MKMAKSGPIGPERAITGTWSKEPGSVLVGTIVESEEQEPFRGSATSNKSRIVYVDGMIYFSADVPAGDGEVLFKAGESVAGVFQWRLDAASQLVWFFPQGSVVRAECAGIVDVGGGRTRTDYVSISNGSAAEEPDEKAHAAPAKEKPQAPKAAPKA